jgi:ABC-type multidrug transport system ATPase subunit/pSer/pThr/pTyr-binding forkhead associated (FHA) protein
LSTTVIPSRYPALLEVATKDLHSLGSASEYVVGRSQDVDLPVLDTSVSRRHFRVVRKGSQFAVEPLSETNPLLCDGRRIAGEHRLAHGMTIRAGTVDFVFLTEDPASEPPDRPPVPQPSFGQTTAHPPQSRQDETVFQPAGAPVAKAITPNTTFALGASIIIGRDVVRASVCLPHAQVSRLHAQVARGSGGYVITDLNSANGTFVNGGRVDTPTLLKTGDKIVVGPYVLYFDGATLAPHSRADNIQLICRGLTRQVRNTSTRQPMRILDDVSLVVRPREFVCLLGPSGSGKSTLLSALSARAPAEEGSVTIDGDNLYENFDSLKQNIAVVPQKDVLHELLPVRVALGYTARLRLPPDTASAEIDGLVNELLATVGLSERRDTLIRHLSGGQVKRASLANEIVNRPALLFLDEVTSGLDEQTDAEMMALFRQIAEDGKTVVCVTHSLANVEASCHRVVILTEGGKLAFAGPPADALRHFGISRLGEIYTKLKEHPAEYWQKAFRSHPLHKADLTTASSPASPKGRARRRALTGAERSMTFMRQTSLLSSRYLRVTLADKPAMLMILTQCLLVALSLVMLYGNVRNDAGPKLASLLFLLGVTAFWFGCNNSAKEIVKEWTIFTRERDVNLLVMSYYASKAILLGLITCLQTMLLFMIVKAGTGLPGFGFGQLAMLTTLGVAGVTVGLLVSSLARNTDVAATIVPMVLIPQIVLAGAIVPVQKMAKFVAASFVTTYWGYGGLVRSLDQSIANRVLDSDGWSGVMAWFVVLFHMLLFLGAGILVLLGRDRRNNVYGRAVDKWLAGSSDRNQRDAVASAGPSADHTIRP